jgi:hypothetical protein
MVDEKDEVTLPGSEDEEEEKVAEETPEEPGNVDPPAEDTVELPDEDALEAEEPVSEEVPQDVPVKITTVARERLKIIQSRNIGEVETGYDAWYQEFSSVEKPGHIVERHIVEGGNGLIILCVFYTVFEPAE